MPRNRNHHEEGKCDIREKRPRAEITPKENKVPRAEDNGSHLVDVDNLASDAKKRLREIGQDDLDQLYSLRISGKKRIWGIREGYLLWFLWWDPFHSVCPSTKKHT